MTNITDQLAAVDFTGARLDGIHAQAAVTADYARRIHWWIRLFGIIWIGIPAAAALFMAVFMLAAMAKSGS